VEELEPIRDLFQDPDLRSRLGKAHSEEEALGLLVSVGAVKDVSFSADSLKRLIGVLSSPDRRGPDDTDLTQVSGQRMADTHVHMSCCTDCPGSAGLCC
jgi:hypothetical protein